MRGYPNDVGIPFESLQAAHREAAASALHGAHLDAEEAYRRAQVAWRAYATAPEEDRERARAVYRLADTKRSLALSVLETAIREHSEAWGLR